VGDGMKIHMTGNTALLEGDWTLTGVTKSNIDSMADTLQQINTSGVKEIHIDCRNVSSIMHNQDTGKGYSLDRVY
jgi:hypothetical protein